MIERGPASRPPKKSLEKGLREKVRWRRSVGEDPSEKVHGRRPTGEGPLEKVNGRSFAEGHQKSGLSENRASRKEESDRIPCEEKNNSLIFLD